MGVVMGGNGGAQGSSLGRKEKKAEIFLGY